MTSRWRYSAASFGLVIALAACGDDLAVERAEQDAVPNADSVPTSIVPTTAASPTTTSSAAASSTSTESTSTASTSTAVPIVLPSISANEIHLEPAGPYVDGQEVTLYANDERFIDLYNSSPRICAVIDGAPEVCGAEWLTPQPVPRPPAGTQAVTVELLRTHFGPSGADRLWCYQRRMPARVAERDGRTVDQLSSCLRRSECPDRRV